MCESDLKKLSEFMAPYIAAKFDAPPELIARTLYAIRKMGYGGKGNQ